ncbi:ArsR/SmtB family transcription factor [Desulfobacterota bacterium M19]
MKNFIRVMKALSDPGRIRILKMLEQKEMCVCEIQAVLNLAQPTISKHLKLMEDAGLVERHKDKVWVNYSLARNVDCQYAATMLKLLPQWFNDNPQVIDNLRQARDTNREDIYQEK